MTLSPPFCNCCVIIFTRYPEKGKTKTRMIPALGALGAAELQRQMTEHTVSQVRKLCHQYPVSLSIYYTGGSLNVMKNWLGNHYNYVNQRSGDLGKRLKGAFEKSFDAGMQKVLIIGIDCPDITPEILKQGFEALDHHDLVLGPAKDGGYYLIGKRRLIPEVLRGIDWGTEKVLQQTSSIAAQLSIKMAFLPQLADVDRPEDLAIWRKYYEL